jgi:hypothetical protein
MKDRKFYMPTHPGAESQFKLAIARMRVAEEEGETGHFPATQLASIIGSKGIAICDASPYLGATDARVVATLATGHASTLSYVTESGSSPGGHQFLSNATPAAADEALIVGKRGLLITGTAAGGEPGYSDAYVFTTQLQVSSTDASTGVGFSCGFLPAGATASPLKTAPANALYFSYDPTIADAWVQFSTIYNSGSANLLDGVTNPFANTGGFLAPTAATDLRLTMAFGQSVDGTNWGWVYVGNYAAGGSGVRTPMTAAMLSNVGSMISAGGIYLAPFIGMYMHGATQRSVYFQNLVAYGDK